MRNCVERPSIYRRNLGTLDAILALDLDVEILLEFTFLILAENPRRISTSRWTVKIASRVLMFLL